MIHRRDFLKIMGVGMAAISLPMGSETRPNVILIMTDDQGYGDLGATGNPVIKTPNLDRLAQESGSMENFYVSPVCAPTRACLMTGRYNYRTRCIDTFVGRAMMDTQEVTLAEILKDNGYATGIFGKWHLGDNYPMRPMDQGFEESLVHRGGGIGQPSDPPGGERKYTDPILFHNGNQVQMTGYCTDLYFDRAIEWIKKNHKQEKSFFAYIPTNAPHGPVHDVPNDLYQAYKKTNLGDDQFPHDKGHKPPENKDTDTLARIFAMITNVDHNVGRLMKQLKELDIAENTIVIFMVDNGPNTRRYVGGYKANKGHVYEGGIRSPFYFCWPETIKPGKASDRICAHIDMLPTLLDACGVSIPEGLRLDGLSLMPLLRREKTHWPDRMIVIQSHRGNQPVLYHHFAARTQKYKLVHPSGFGKETFEGEPKFELYDMEKDPYEMTDLAESKPEVKERLRKRYEAWFQDVSSTRPDNYAPPRIHIGTVHENPVVLTRQDWRHVSGRPWGKNSNGCWLLHAAKDGKYDINLRFPEMSQAGEAVIRMGAQLKTKPLQKGDTEIRFEAIDLKQGNLKFMAELKFGKIVRGPHQADIIKR